MDKGSVVRNTYMMGSDYYETLDEVENNKIDIMMGIGENCLIENAIIDKNARIGDNVILVGGDKVPDQETDLLTVIDGIVVVKKGAIIPNGYQLK